MNHVKRTAIGRGVSTSWQLPYAFLRHAGLTVA
jgi:hypothetical protein